jgi:ParB family chromosome partitioning protein
MPKINPKIKSMDDLLRLDAEYVQRPSIDQDSNIQIQANEITNLSIAKIRMFRNHPFCLYEGERLDDMAESIKANGILVPVIIRRIETDDNGCEYEMLAGHNRMNAALIAGLDQLPCIVKENLSDEEALMYVVETNVLQRSFADMCKSEKAKVLSLRYLKMFSQGKRNDIISELKRLENPQCNNEDSTCGPMDHKLKSREKIGIEYGLSSATIARLLKLDTLVYELKKRVDTDEISLRCAVDFSYLTETEQRMVETVLSENEYKVDMKKSELLRNYSGRLNSELAYKILSGEKNKKPKSSILPPIKVKHTVYSKYFAPNTKVSEIERIIDVALNEYFERHENKTEEQL